VPLLPALAMLLVAVLTLGGCWSRRAPQGEERATLSVENRRPYDMTMYVYRGAARARLGIARSNATTVLVIPRDVVGFGTKLRFVGDAVASRGQSVVEEFNVSPGTSVRLRIPGA
jgi:hypothetical protein